jgi:hypothetical protein
MNRFELGTSNARREAWSDYKETGYSEFEVPVGDGYYSLRRRERINLVDENQLPLLQRTVVREAIARERRKLKNRKTAR